MLGEGEFEGDAYVLFGRGESDGFSLHTVAANRDETGRPPVRTSHSRRRARMR